MPTTTTPPRLTLYPLSETQRSEEQALQAFWSDLLEDYMPEKNPLARPRLNPLSATIQHVMGLGCAAVIVQSHVQDPDYLAEYHAYHGRIFSDIERYCKRLHCFRCRWDDDTDVLDAIDKAQDDDYLGFITLRPVKSSPMGATILRPPEGKGHFLLSKDRFEVHLAGKTFHVTGTPFMQQDNAVGACAQASIWMALRTLRKREGRAAYDPAQITSSATRFFVQGRTLPNRDGLVVSQMMEAVRSAGYSPTLLRFREPHQPARGFLLPQIRSSLYPYIESEIPVIMVMSTPSLGGHAVVAIGHGWEPEPALCSPVVVVKGDQVKYVASSADWATPFYMHNDNGGPYLPLPDSSDAESYALDKVCYAIPFLPADVYMTAEEAEQAAVLMLDRFTDGQFLDSRVHVLRTYLQERHRFRANVRDSDMTRELKRYYRLKSIPRRVWVTEINLREGYEQAFPAKATRVGEVLIDPTTDPTQGAFLSIHIPDVLIDRDPNSEEIRIMPVINDVVYTPLLRHY